MARSRHTPAGRGGSWIRPSTRWAIYHRDDFACVYCGHVGRLTIDHLESVEEHGRNEDHTNLVTACISCNSIKQNLTKREWFAKLRDKGIDTEAVRRHIHRVTSKELDRRRGRFLASYRTELEELELWIPGLADLSDLGGS